VTAAAAAAVAAANHITCMQCIHWPAVYVTRCHVIISTCLQSVVIGRHSSSSLALCMSAELRALRLASPANCMLSAAATGPWLVCFQCSGYRFLMSKMWTKTVDEVLHLVIARRKCRNIDRYWHLFHNESLGSALQSLYSVSKREFYHIIISNLRYGTVRLLLLAQKLKFEAKTKMLSKNSL